jgi:hypothetical protein
LKDHGFKTAEKIAALKGHGSIRAANAKMNNDPPKNPGGPRPIEGRRNPAQLP